MRILFIMFNVLMIILNGYIVMFLYGVKELKVSGDIPTFYKYLLLDSKIREVNSKIEGQNIFTEKGGVRIIKQQSYVLTKDSLVSGSLFMTKKFGSLSRDVVQDFTNKSLKDLLTLNPELTSVLIKQFSGVEVPEYLTLSASQVQDILNQTSSNTIQSFTTLN